MSETPKKQPPRPFRVSFDIQNKERQDEVMRLIRATKVGNPTALILHTISVARKLYEHKQAGGTIVLRGPRGAEEELKLL